MKATIGVYEDQASAVEAVNALKAAGFPADKISILGRTNQSSQAGHEEDPGESEEGDGIDSDDAFKKPMRIAATGVGVGAIVGPIIGALAGVGLLAVPGLGLLVGAGALAGAIAGLDVGIIGGGIISALAIASINKHHEDLYHEHLQAGRFIVIAQGNQEQIEHAKEVLHEHDEHLHLNIHH